MAFLSRNFNLLLLTLIFEMFSKVLSPTVMYFSILIINTSRVFFSTKNFPLIKNNQKMLGRGEGGRNLQKAKKNLKNYGNNYKLA